MIFINKLFNIWKKILLVIIIGLCFIIPYGSRSNAVNVTNKFVLVGGDSIGLSMNIQPYVCGKYDVKTKQGVVKPWINSDIQENDVIIRINDIDVDDISSIKNTLKQSKEGINDIVVRRSDKEIKTNIVVCVNEYNEKTIGLYVKDQMLGVGTMTFYDMENNSFASLGHKAIDNKIIEGHICNSYVSGIKKGTRGAPGEKQAFLDKEIIGTINYNNSFGVFGKITFKRSSFNKLTDYMEVAKASNVTIGDASIITVIEGNIKEEFKIKIIDVKDQLKEDIKGIKFEVIDSSLLERCGGIIQGMSGSPIIQGNKIVGAVSHVLVDDCKIGYGVFAEWMLNYCK